MTTQRLIPLEQLLDEDLGAVTAALAGELADQVVILVTRWPQFDALAGLLRGRADQPLVVDGRRVLHPTDFARYEGIGLRRSNGADR